MTQRDRQDEAIGIIRRLFNGERVTAKSDWFTMNDAALQLLPLQEEMPFVVASQISPSGMTLGRKYGIGIILARLDVDARPDGAADAMGFCGRTPRRRPHHGEPRQLARAAVLAHCGDPRARRGARPAKD